ncbi:MAG: ADP-ribosylglycohydrolase family protein [Acidiferrobacterales bacterium]
MKFAGALVGSALGDAIGELAFRYGRRDRLLTRIEQLGTLTYTDDTAMAIALAETLATTGDVKSQQLGDTFRAHFTREPWRGYGPGPPAIFARVAAGGISYEAAARELYGEQGSFGNGAAMRIAPLALFFCDSDVLYQKAEASALVTHTHPIGVDGAAIQARAIARASLLEHDRALDVQVFMQDLIVFARTAAIRSKLEAVQRLILDNTPPPEAARRLGLSIAVQESMPFALYCFLRHPDEYAQCLYAAILHGGDRDTMGAMAGAISGAYLGIDAIPMDWRSKLENGERIEKLAYELLAKRKNQ